MTTRNIVPQAPGEGGLGTPVKPWGRLCAQDIQSPAVRRRLVADTTFYVRTDGNDSNDGLSDTAAGAFATPKGAFDAIASRYDINGYTVTISVADGAYPDFVVDLSQLVGAAGYGVTPTTAPPKVVLQGQGQNTILNSVRAYSIGLLQVKNLQSAGYFQADFGAALMVTDNIWLSGLYGFSLNGGDIFLRAAAVTFLSRSMTFVFQATRGGRMLLGASTYNAPAAVTVTDTFAIAVTGGLLENNGRAQFAGNFTGKRYKAETSGIIQTAGGGVNCFPGTTAGTVSSGGVYV